MTSKNSLFTYEISPQNDPETDFSEKTYSD